MHKYSIDTAIRVTDCPVISSEIIEFLIKNHIKNNSDLTCAINFAVGTAGEIYSVGSLEQILLKTKRLDILNIYLSITLIIQVILKSLSVIYPKNLLENIDLQLITMKI